MTARILVGDVRERLAELPAASVHCCVTSPPYYGLRDYGVPGQLGLEPTLAEYIATMVDVFREVRRVLRDDGTLWLNIGDSYAGGGNGARDAERWPKQSRNGHGFRSTHSKKQAGENLKPKDLMMVPARLAIALVDDGWYLRSDIIWHKRAPMPESVTDRPTSAHEHIFLLSKQPRYFYDTDAVREESEYDGPPKPGAQASITSLGGKDTMRLGVGNPAGRNQRNVWLLGPEPFPEAHFATFPTEIPRRAIKAGTSERGVCPTCGASWVRTSERVNTDKMQRKGASWDLGEGAHGSFHRQGRAPVIEYAPVTVSVTTGWAPSCSCGGDPVPATVLDPFLGSGTTLLVADELGRDGIGIELNETYAAMAERRIRGACPMFADVGVAS